MQIYHQCMRCMSSSSFFQMWRRDPSSSNNAGALVNVAKLASDLSGLTLIKSVIQLAQCVLCRSYHSQTVVAAAHLSAEDKFRRMSMLMI